MSDILLTKGQEQERAQRRMEKYRARHEESIPRFEHTFNSINEQQRQDTLNLRQRFLEPRAKKSSKKTDKKTTTQPSPAEPQNTNNTSTVNTASKLPKRDRSSEEIDLTEQHNGHEQTKMGHCNGSSSPTFKKRKNDTTTSITKFPADTVHQVKNGSTPVSNLKPNPKDSPALAAPTPPRYGSAPVAPPEICMKQENHDVSNFADLDQCAAALEKDGTTSFSTSMGYIEGTSDGYIPSDTLKDLIFDVADLNPDFIGDFDFDEDRHSQSTNQSCYSSSHYHGTPITPSSVTFSPRNVKQEEGPSPAANSTASPHLSQTPPQVPNMFDPTSSPSGTNHSTSRSSTPNASYCPQTVSPTTGNPKHIRMPYESPTMGHDSPAAQTLKQMAAHHQQQHKQLEIAGAFQAQPPQSNSSPVRSPFGSDPYSPMNGDFVPTGPGAAFRNVRCHSGDGVVVKQENPGPMYGACPTYPRSPVDLIAMAKRSKSPGTMGHSKSFTQAHLNPQLPPSYRTSFSPPTTFPPSNQPIFMQHKINSSQQMTLQQQHSAVHQGPQMTMGQDLKGGGLPMVHHQPFPPSQYYHAAASDGCFPGAPQQDKGQTINFTQQHLRLSQSGHPQQQQAMGGRMGVIPNPQQQSLVGHHIDRSRQPLRLPSGEGEISDVGSRVPLEVQHRMMMREGMGGNVPGSDMMNRFHNGSSLVPGQGPNQRHRHQLIGDTGGYHHQQMGPQHMGIPPRRLGPPCPLPGQDNRISNQNQPHSQHHDNTWHPHSALPDHARSFHQQQHFHSTGVSQQQSMSFVANHQSGGFGYAQNQRLTHSTKNDGKIGGSGDDSGGVVLKTEADSSDFNLLLEGMGDDYSFDPASSYQNILDTF